MKPLPNRILIHVDEESEKKTASGILLVKEQETELKKGVITAVGEGIEAVEVGDTVYFAHFGLPQIENTYIAEEIDVKAICETSSKK